ncbi:MAG: MATE family efflux transporter [Clostridia bacterium]|nr:MATE family efflux transporter [Clostridia bacterium]
MLNNTELNPNDKKERFIRTAISLAVPIALQNLLTSCAAIVDTSMVVSLNNDATAAMGLASRFAFMLNLIAFGFCSGIASLTSQYHGAGQKDNCAKTYGLGLSLSMTIAIIYAILLALFPSALISIFKRDSAEVIALGAGYLRIFAIGVPAVMFTQISCASLRATEKVYVPLAASLAGVAVNVFFNWCFIFGNLGLPRLGLNGAAVATVISSYIQALIVIVALFATKNEIRTKLSCYLDIKSVFLKKYFKVSMPVLLNETMWGLGTNIYVVVLAGLGTENYAGYTIYETVQQLFFVFFVGISHACSIMVGKKMGEGLNDTAFRYAKRFLIITPALALAIGAIILAVRNPILSLMPIETEAARSVASTILMLYGLWLPVRMIPYTAICGIFRAGGDTRTGCIYEIIAMYLIGIPLVFLFGFGIGIEYHLIVLVMYVAEDTPKAILALIHFFRKKWMFNLAVKQVD